MPDEQKKVLRIKRTVTVVQEVPLEHYTDMTEDQAVQYEVAMDGTMRMEAVLMAIEYAEGNPDVIAKPDWRVTVQVINAAE